VPTQIAAAGDHARRRFFEFFTANIRSRNTRAADAQAVAGFFRWCEARGLTELGRLEPVHVAAYGEQLGKTHAAPSAKQHLAAVRMLFDWLVVGQVVRANPASVVRGPSTWSRGAGRRSSRPRKRASCSRVFPPTAWWPYAIGRSLAC
jgi:site-specific recombinase XerD